MGIVMVVVMRFPNPRPAMGDGVALCLRAPLRNHWRGKSFVMRQTFHLWFLHRLDGQPTHAAKLVALSIPISANAAKSHGTLVGFLLLKFSRCTLTVSLRGQPLHDLKGRCHRILTGLRMSHFRR